VQRLARLARSRGILTIVDGAHALAHFPFKLRDLECDYYGVSLHKWLLAPLGNGLLYVRKENIARTWPLQGSRHVRRRDARRREQRVTGACDGAWRPRRELSRVTVALAAGTRVSTGPGCG
jgi:isopenicillin-N epimerase